MLSQDVVIEIARLLFEGELSHRQIAARLGVGRSTVDAIASGRRGLHGSDHRTEYSPPSAAGGAMPERCPHCGARIFPPCIACRAREYGYRREKGRPREKGAAA